MHAEKSSTAGREMVLTRVIDAPRELVFAAWTDAKHVSQWWGPRGFTTTTHASDFRVGGVWRFTMHGPDGTDYANRITYTEIVRPERLAYDHGDDKNPRMFRASVVFDEQGGKTLVTLRALFDTVEECRQTMASGAVEGGNQTLERFAQYLAGK